jgi:hypothetical protein
MPGVRSIPKRVPIYRVTWRASYKQIHNTQRD